MIKIYQLSHEIQRNCNRKIRNFQNTLLLYFQRRRETVNKINVAFRIKYWIHFVKNADQHEQIFRIRYTTAQKRTD